MTENKGRFIIDESVLQDVRDKISEKIDTNLELMNQEVSDRIPILSKRQDFFEGRHHNWTNVQGQVVKQQEGHILATFNYINRFCQKLSQTLTNNPPRMKVKSTDEANEIETSRAEMVETALLKVLKDNLFYQVIFKKASINQIRDADFILECKVMEDVKGKRIEIRANEDLTKIKVGWDDASGTSFSFIAYEDMMSVAKIKRDFGYDAEPLSDSQLSNSQNSKGNHLSDQYGLMSAGGGHSESTPSGTNKLPQARVCDYWGYEVINDEVKVINVVKINKDMVQFVVTEYKQIPKFVGHSLLVAGKPWSMGFIDPLVDAQIELNDRTGEEGDMIRLGSHMKFLAVNMSDFDPDSVKPGSGQVIFIEGEGADFRPLQMSISPFPSADYINRILEHLFTLGIPKISLAAGTAPYTGKVGAIQYQPFADLVNDYRIQWEVVMQQMFKMIQEYFIAYFPETLSFMKESIYDEATKTYSEGEPIVRDIEFDWENVLPLSRSDKVIDASTLRDRGAISLDSYLTEAGFRDPGKEIKKIKKEAKDSDLMSAIPKFQQLSSGVVKAQNDAAVQTAKAQENMPIPPQTDVQPSSSTATPAPVLHSNQNDGRRGILSGTGTPSGQTASAAGAVAQASQNSNAQAGH